ncbi:DUF645 family protein, partial [Vibrio cholerae]|nr:DUF645 family protein [Vibrio cholerae]
MIAVIWLSLSRTLKVLGVN